MPHASSRRCPEAAQIYCHHLMMRKTTTHHAHDHSAILRDEATITVHRSRCSDCLIVAWCSSMMYVGSPVTLLLNQSRTSDGVHVHKYTGNMSVHAMMLLSTSELLSYSACQQWHIHAPCMHECVHSIYCILHSLAMHPCWRLTRRCMMIFCWHLSAPVCILHQKICTQQD